MIELPSGVDIKNLINDLRSLSWEVSDTLLQYSQILKDPNNKSNILKNGNEDDPVTLADLKVNEIIITGINEKYSNVNWSILSEENVKSGSQSNCGDRDWLWILDPLDGTKDFIQGTSNYSMHLALNYKNKPYIGVVLIPEKEELWIAYNNAILCENRDGSKIKYNLSNNKSLNNMVLVTSKNHKNNILKDLITQLNFKKVIVMGSIGCKIASILRGESDIYICLSMPGKSSPKDWDFAAPHAILENAGGAITNLDNHDLTYNNLNFLQSGIIIASNDKHNHKQICEDIKNIILKNNIYPLNS